MIKPNDHPSQDGVVHAATREGYVLPVIDVTHPRFAVPDDAASAAALYGAFAEEERKRRRLPQFLMRFMLKRMAKRSLLLKALFGGTTGFLDGTSTYVMKLGPENLPPPFDGPLDRKLAGSPHVGLLRLRMQQTARLLADALAAPLSQKPEAPLHLINIGGGPAIDSMNTLILLMRGQPELMRRPIVIHVLDGDEDGPFFGANALAALKGDGAPLYGLDITFRHEIYDWNDTALLERLVADLAARGAVIGASSEGALFEYGSDAAIVINLEALLAGGRGARQISGSVTCSDETRRRMIATSNFKLMARGIEGFAPLATRAGFIIARHEHAGLSDQVLLVPV